MSRALGRGGGRGPWSPTGVLTVDPLLARRAFRAAAVVEALTWAGLLVGMYLKHVSGTTEAGVWLFGRLHGAAFLGYLAATVLAARALRWGPVVTLVALAASVPPLATVVVEGLLRRRGLLEPPAVAAAPLRSGRELLRR